MVLSSGLAHAGPRALEDIRLPLWALSECPGSSATSVGGRGIRALRPVPVLVWPSGYRLIRLSASCQRLLSGGPVSRRMVPPRGLGVEQFQVGAGAVAGQRQAGPTANVAAISVDPGSRLGSMISSMNRASGQRVR